MRKLRGKLPKESLIVPECIKPMYPTGILNELQNSFESKDTFELENSSKFSIFGLITEEFLFLQEISGDSFSKLVQKMTSVKLSKKVLSSKPTERYFNNIKNTIVKLKNLLGNEPFKRNAETTRDDCKIEGHPDIITDTQIFEIKTTRQIKKNWIDFLLQTFSYSALNPSAKVIHIVLPLSEHIWSFNICEWKKRELFFNELKNFKPPNLSIDFFNQMVLTFPIGHHVKKLKTIFDSVKNHPADLPFQIFFAVNTNLKVSDSDIAETLNFVINSGIKLFVHIPYLLNLCKKCEDNDNYIVENTQAHLVYASTMNFKGAVIHVGKHLDIDIKQSLENMKYNICKSIDVASGRLSGETFCPLLIETPAGQGTEVLTKFEDFMKFIEDIHETKEYTNKIGICLDTCHVFATGQSPLKYLQDILNNQKWKSYIRLIHLNDSKKEFGCCVDRHSILGCGCISKDELYKIAELAALNKILMLME